MTAAIVLAGAPDGPDVLEGLAGRLDLSRRRVLQATLLAHAEAWAATVAPEAVTVLLHRGDAETQLEPAVAAAFDAHGAPVIVVNAGVPRLGPVHAAGALGDLAAGAAVTFGPHMDGGWYLVALASPLPELLSLAVDVWEGPVVMARMFQVAARLDLEFGLLRMERRLATADDMAAVLLDPLTPAAIRTALVQE